MAFGVGDNLKVRVSAQTQDFVRGMERAKEKTEELGDTATATSAQLGVMGGVASVTTGRITVLNGALSLTITQLGAIVAITTPLVAGLTAIAGAAAAIVGSGLLAFGQKRAEQNKQRLKQLNQRIKAFEKVKQSEAKLTQQSKQTLKQLKQQKRELKEQTSITGALAAALKPIGAAFRDAFANAGSQFIPLITDALNALPGLIRKLGQALANANVGNLITLLRNLGRFILNNAVPAFKAFLNFANQSAGALNTLGNFITQRLIPAFNQKFLPTFQKAAQVFRSEVLPAIREMLPTLKGIIGGLVILTARAQPLIQRVLPALGSALAGVIRITNSLLNVYTAVAKLLTGDFAGAMRDATQSLHLFVQGVRNIVDPIINIFRGLFKTLIGNSIIPDGIRDIANYLSGAGKRLVVNAMSGLVGGLVKTVRNQFQKFKRAGRDLAKTFANGIESGKGFIARATEKVTNAADRYLPGSNAEIGPLSNLRSSGRAIPITIAEGIEQSQTQLISQLEQTLQAGARILRSNQMLQTASSLGSRLASRIGGNLTLGQLERSLRERFRSITGQRFSETPQRVLQLTADNESRLGRIVSGLQRVQDATDITDLPQGLVVDLAEPLIQQRLEMRRFQRGLEARLARRFNQTQQTQGPRDIQVEVAVKGDTDVIKEVTAQAIHDEARRTRERSGSQNRP